MAALTVAAMAVVPGEEARGRPCVRASGCEPEARCKNSDEGDKVMPALAGVHRESLRGGYR
jgi:hypothetical protein